MGRVGDLLGLFRKVDSLLQLEEKHGKAIQALEEQQSSLRDRLTALEAREGMVVAEVKAAARAGAQEAAMGSIADMARRIGALEAGAGQKRVARKPKGG